MLYCTYDTLNMFRALLCPSSGALDYMYAIATYGVQCLVACCRGSGAGQQGVRPERGMLEEKPTRCHCMLYCTYDTLNMFQALLCPSSGALVYMYAIAGCASRKRDAGASLFLDAHPAALNLTPDNQRPSTAHHRRQ